MRDRSNFYAGIRLCIKGYLKQARGQGGGLLSKIALVDHGCFERLELWCHCVKAFYFGRSYFQVSRIIHREYFHPGI